MQFDVLNTYRLTRHLFFNKAFYNRQFPGVTNHGIAHYLRKGFLKGCDPHPLFCTKFVLSQFEFTRFQNVFMNFAVHSKNKRYVSPSQLFDVNFYLSRYRDVYEANVDPFLHFCLYGFFEGRQSSMMFEPDPPPINKQRKRRKFIREIGSLDTFVMEYDSSFFFDVKSLRSKYGDSIIRNFFTGDILDSFNYEHVFGSVNECDVESLDLFSKLYSNFHNNLSSRNSIQENNHGL